MTYSPVEPGKELAAVLFDMDGTLLDSEKVWDVSLEMLAEHLGGRLSAEARASMIGSSMARSVAIIHADLGLPSGEDEDRRSAEFLTEATARLFDTRLVWRPGAAELLDAVRAAGIPIALVTSTERRLTDIAMAWMGRERFDVSVCGDEVTRPKPAPDPYLQAASMLGVEADRCVVVEDSILGATAGQAAGCAVLAVPCDVDIPPDEGRTVLPTLTGLGVADLAALLPGRTRQSVSGSGSGGAGGRSG